MDRKWGIRTSIHASSATAALLEPEILQIETPAPAAYVRRPALPALTGIRALLAIGIVLFHFTPPHLGPFYPLIDHAFVFVGFFFLLSGYILSYNYSDRALTLVPRDFWLARLSRLYPIYLVTLALSFRMLQEEWHVHTRLEFWQGVLLTPLLLQAWSPGLATFWNTVAWTLSAEIVLYVSFPWVIRTWARRAARFETPANLIGLLLGLWLVGMMPHVVYLLLNPDHLNGLPDRYTSTSMIRILKFTPLPYLTTFLAGVALGKLQLLLELTPRQRLGVAAAALVALWGFFYLTATHTPYLLMHGGLLIPLFAALIIGLSGRHPISSVFAWRPLLVLGEASYCLYLLHFNGFILIHTYRIPERLHLTALDPWLSYGLLLVMAYAAFHSVENPARKLILRRFGRTAKPAGLST